MKRDEKVKLLKDLQIGKKTLKDAFPPLKVGLLEVEKGIWWYSVTRKSIRTEDVDQFVEELRQGHPGGEVIVSKMDHERYLIESERLEQEY